MALTSNNYTHFTGTGTFVITPQRCGLEAVFVNQAGGAGCTVTVTDGASNTIAIRDGSSIHKFDPDLANLLGLIVVVAGGSGAGDFTCVWQ